jgi:hypothetical protein
MQKRINWQSLGAQVVASGLTTLAVAELCGTGQPQISKIFTGFTQNPAYPLGQALVELFKVRCPGADLPEMPVEQTNTTHLATQSVAS